MQLPNSPRPPPPPPPQNRTPPLHVSPYNSHIRFMRSRSTDPQEVQIARNCAIKARNAPAVQCHPEHATIKRMNAACISGDFDILRDLVEAWQIIHDPVPGPPGHEIYALEPGFYLAIQQSQRNIVEYFFDHGIRLCSLAVDQAISCRSTPAIFQSFFDRGWDIHDNPSETGCWFPWSPLWYVLLPSRPTEDG